MIHVHSFIQLLIVIISLPASQDTWHSLYLLCCSNYSQQANIFAYYRMYAGSAVLASIALKIIRVTRLQLLALLQLSTGSSVFQSWVSWVEIIVLALWHGECAAAMHTRINSNPLFFLHYWTILLEQSCTCFALLGSQRCSHSVGVACPSSCEFWQGWEMTPVN